VGAGRMMDAAFEEGTIDISVRKMISTYFMKDLNSNFYKNNQ
jgi:hypothetical protein